MNTYYDQVLIDTFQNEIISKNIIIHENTEIVEVIEVKYIMGSSSIDWSKNNLIYFREFDCNQETFLKEIIKDLNLIHKKYLNSKNEKILLIGDNLINLSYEMNFDFFLNNYQEFLTIPQHTYIWFYNLEKCLNISMTNKLYFG